jgi:hypothetical protein
LLNLGQVYIETAFPGAVIFEAGILKVARNIGVREILNPSTNRRNRPNMDIQPAKAFKWSCVLFVPFQFFFAKFFSSREGSDCGGGRETKAVFFALQLHHSFVCINPARLRGHLVSL